MSAYKTNTALLPTQPAASHSVKRLFGRALCTTVLVSCCAFSLPAQAKKNIFITKTYRVLVNRNCTDIIKVCKDITFATKHKINGTIAIIRGQQSRLKSTKHQNQPTDQIYYIYKNQDNSFNIITQNNHLVHVKEGKVTLKEKGEWLEKSY